MPPTPQVTAIGLISGGLDSTLAAGILKELGVAVVGLNFSTGFCKVDHRRAINDPDEPPERLRNPALRAGAIVGFPVEVIDVAEAYLEVVKNPRYGYGANVNPCIDCRIFMLIWAREVMEERGADLVFTGEVIGQRPMSQYRKALDLVEKRAGLSGRLLRPLSAHLLEPTEPERDGRVDRDRLLAIQGRSRKPQIDLAERLGVSEYPQPAGGCCFLADPNFARRFRDLVDHDQLDGPDDATLLKVGRHFRVSDGVKLVAGRNEGENRFLQRYRDGRWSFQSADEASPVGICLGEPTGDEWQLMAAIVARYSRDRTRAEVEIVASRGEVSRRVHVAPASEKVVRDLLL
ncbi:MAG: thiamine biosynthesis protein [Acidobacteriota bacterium]